MKRINKQNWKWFFLMIIFSCGGTHGKIHNFDLKHQKTETEAKILKMISDSIKFLPNDMTNYFDVRLEKASKYKVYTYHFYGDSAYWQDNPARISLVYVKEGDYYLKEEDLSSEEKKIAIKEFENHFINYLE